MRFPGRAGREGDHAYRSGHDALREDREGASHAARPPHVARFDRDPSVDTRAVLLPGTRHGPPASAVAGLPKVCNYLDIPIQHIDADILKKMNRKAPPGRYAPCIRASAASAPGSPCGPRSSPGSPGRARRSSRACAASSKNARSTISARSPSPPRTARPPPGSPDRSRSACGKGAGKG